jgi:anaerobic glycerol-3-phosphate dehydrogenase
MSNSPKVTDTMKDAVDELLALPPEEFERLLKEQTNKTNRNNLEENLYTIGQYYGGYNPDKEVCRSSPEFLRET